MDEIACVAQPLVGYYQGIVIGFEGHAGYGVGNGWEGTVELTCAENSTRVGGAPENRNAASLIGLEFRHVPKVPHTADGPRFEPYFGDTLRVVLQVPQRALDASQESEGLGIPASLREIVCATIECAVINAANPMARSDKNPLRYLAVEIEGWEGAADLARTYSLQELPALEQLCRRDSYGGVVRPSFCE
jgi:hypothetical protein